MTAEHALSYLKRDPLNFLKQCYIKPLAATQNKVKESVSQYYLLKKDMALVKLPNAPVKRKLFKRAEPAKPDVFVDDAFYLKPTVTATERPTAKECSVINIAVQQEDDVMKNGTAILNLRPLQGADIMITTQLNGCCMVGKNGGFAHIQPKATNRRIVDGVRLEKLLKRQGFSTLGRATYQNTTCTIFGVRMSGTWKFFTQYSYQYDIQGVKEVQFSQF